MIVTQSWKPCRKVVTPVVVALCLLGMIKLDNRWYDIAVLGWDAAECLKIPENCREKLFGEYYKRSFLQTEASFPNLPWPSHILTGRGERNEVQKNLIQKYTEP